MESPAFLIRKPKSQTGRPDRPISDLGSRFSDAGLVHFLNSRSRCNVDASSILVPGTASVLGYCFALHTCEIQAQGTAGTAAIVWVVPQISAAQTGWSEWM